MAIKRAVTMGNTRILAKNFEWLSPKTLPEVLQLLGRYGGSAKIIAGGTDVIPQMKVEKILPSVLIDVMKVRELNIIQGKGTLRIGATVKLRDIEGYCKDKLDYACLHDALRSIGKIQVLNMGTLGGNLCTASPAADSAPALLVLKSRVKLIGERAERLVALEDFFRGPGITVMDPGEILSEIQIPAVSDNGGNAFLKIARVAADISKINCAVAVERDGATCISCRIAMGAVAAMPIRIPSAERLLSGQKIDDALIDETAKVVSADIKPISDARSTEIYRRQVSRILFKDTFAKAWNRVGTDK